MLVTQNQWVLPVSGDDDSFLKYTSIFLHRFVLKVVTRPPVLWPKGGANSTHRFNNAVVNNGSARDQTDLLKGRRTLKHGPSLAALFNQGRVICCSFFLGNLSYAKNHRKKQRDDISRQVDTVSSKLLSNQTALKIAERNLCSQRWG